MVFITIKPIIMPFVLFQHYSFDLSSPRCVCPPSFFLSFSSTNVRPRATRRKLAHKTAPTSMIHTPISRSVRSLARNCESMNKMTARSRYGIILRRDQTTRLEKLALTDRPLIVISPLAALISIPRPFNSSSVPSPLDPFCLIDWLECVLRNSTADTRSSTTLSSPRHLSSSPFFLASISLNSAQRRRVLTSSSCIIINCL